MHERHPPWLWILGQAQDDARGGQATAVTGLRAYNPYARISA